MIFNLSVKILRLKYLTEKAEYLDLCKINISGQGYKPPHYADGTLYTGDIDAGLGMKPESITSSQHEINEDSFEHWGSASTVVFSTQEVRNSEVEEILDNIITFIEELHMDKAELDVSSFSDDDAMLID